MTICDAGRDPIRVAVVIGKHNFDVPMFWEMLRSMPDMEYYPQDLENYAATKPDICNSYDVIVFYNFHVSFPSVLRSPPHCVRTARSNREPDAEVVRAGLEMTLGSRRPGILLLHHAILAFPEWDQWSEMTGIDDRRFDFAMQQTVTAEIADPMHPITRGLRSFTLIDETYAMNEPSEDSTILVTTSCPGSMRALAWTRTYREAQVVCIQSGHDARAYGNEDFRVLLSRSIRWLAGCT